MAAIAEVAEAKLVGDGRRLDSPALQRAIVACAARGGGRVVVPPGVYRCGTIRLRDRVTLELSRGATILVSDLPAEIGERDRPAPAEAGRESFQEMKARKVAAMETGYVRELLQRHGGNVTRSAESAGMTRSAFQKLMQRYEIKSSEFRDSGA